MQKFFIALIAALVLTVNNFAAATTEFAGEQFDKIVALTVENPAASESKTLQLDAATFQLNYNAFIKNFIRETNAVGDDAVMMEKIFTLSDAKTFSNGTNQIFAKNFMNRVIIVGLNENGGKFKVLNFFATPSTERDDSLFNALVLQAFVRGILPDLDAMDLLNEAQKNPSVPVVRNGVKFSVGTVDNINIVTAVAE